MASPRTRRVRNGRPLDAWIDADAAEVRLPSGTWVRIREPDESALIRAGVMPTQLIRSLVSDSDAPLTDSEATKIAEETMAVVDALCRFGVVAVCTVRSGPDAPADGWQRITLSREQYAALPPRDVTAIRQMATGETTAAIVTAYANYRAGDLTEDAAADIVDREATQTPAGWVSFREFAAGGLRGDDGSRVERPTVLANRRARRAAGARGR